MGRVENIVIKKMYDFATMAVENGMNIEKYGLGFDIYDYEGNSYTAEQYTEIVKAEKIMSKSAVMKFIANPSFPAPLMSFVRNSINFDGTDNTLAFEGFWIQHKNEIDELGLTRKEDRIDFFNKLIAFCSVAQMGATNLSLYIHEFLGDTGILGRYTGEYIPRDMPGYDFVTYRDIFKTFDFEEGKELIPISAELVSSPEISGVDDISIFAILKSNLHSADPNDFLLVINKADAKATDNVVYAIPRKDWEFALIVKDSKISRDLEYQRRLVNSSDDYIAIYNVKDINNGGLSSFDNYKYIDAIGKVDEINISNYELGYAESAFLPSSTISNAELESLFVKFNADIKPNGYYTHSLSTSDIIVACAGGDKKAYFVDSIGFKEMPNFFSKELERKFEFDNDILLSDGSRYLYICDSSEGGFDFTIYDEFKREIDGGLYTLDDIADDIDAVIDYFIKEEAHFDGKVTQINDVDGFFDEVYKYEGVSAAFEKKTRELYNKESLGVYLEDIIDVARDYVRAELDFDDSDIDMEIKKVCLIGSRCRGYESDDSDIDILVEYNSTSMKEDAIFNILNGKDINISGRKLDFNPINNFEGHFLESHLLADEDYMSKRQCNKATFDEFSTGFYLKTVNTMGATISYELFDDTFRCINSGMLMMTDVPKRTESVIDSVLENIANFKESPIFKDYVAVDLRNIPRRELATCNDELSINKYIEDFKDRNNFNRTVETDIDDRVVVSARAGR